MARAAMVSDTDFHYQMIGVATLAQNAANDYTEVVLDGNALASNNGTAGHTNSLAPELVMNAFGKDKHGASVWDVKRFRFQTSVPVEQESGQSNRHEYGVHKDNAVLTATISLADDDCVELISEWSETTAGAAGEITQDIRNTRTDIDYPQELLDDNTFGLLLTAQQYSLFVSGSGNAAVKTVALGMIARRVIVPITELFFDRDTIAALLDAVILDSILG